MEKNKMWSWYYENDQGVEMEGLVVATEAEVKDMDGHTVWDNNSNDPEIEVKMDQWNVVTEDQDLIEKMMKAVGNEKTLGGTNVMEMWRDDSVDDIDMVW